MNAKHITKSIEVTISLDTGGKARFDFYEPDSGDYYRIETSLDGFCDEESRIGSELGSWLSLMEDEMEDAKVELAELGVWPYED